LSKIVTLEELDTYWTLNDVADAHEALDIQSENEAYNYNKESK